MNNQHPNMADLLRQLFSDNPEAIKCIDALVPGLPPDERKALLRDMVSCAMPKVPAGRRYCPNSFWAKFQDRFILQWFFTGSPSQQNRHAHWLAENLKRANAPVVSALAYLQPQPRTGK